MAEVKWLQTHSCARRFYRFLFACFGEWAIRSWKERGRDAGFPTGSHAISEKFTGAIESLHTTVACIK